MFVISHNTARYESLSEALMTSLIELGSLKRAKEQKKEVFWALRDLDFDIHRGDRVGIIGRNGAGKSTLLKVLSRITDPTTGRITIDGRVASLLEVGTGFHPELTGRENIFLNGAILGMSRNEIQSKFDTIVDFAEVEQFLDTPVKRYSSGMYVRLAFAVAAHLEPEILIVDEVLSVGDVQFQRKCLGKMEEVSKNEGRTVLFVSHDLSSISKLCNRALLLGNGRLIDSGGVNQVIENYLIQSRENNKEFARIGSREVEVVNLEILSKDGIETSTMSTGGEFTIVMKCHVKRAMKNIQFAVCFNNVYNTRITSLWTAFNGQSFDVIEGQISINFHIKSLGLIPGDYQVITYINWGEVVIERIDNYKYVSIVSPNISVDHVVPTIGQGSYLQEFAVNIKE